MQGGVGFGKALGDHPPFDREAAQARRVLERLALHLGRRLRLLPQIQKERVEHCRVVVAEMVRRLGNGERVETDEMRRKAFGERRG